MTIAVRWTAGRHHGLAWPGGVALLHGSLPLTTLGALLEGLVARPGDLDDVCRRLDGAAPTVPAAVAVHTEGDVAAALRTPDGWTRQPLGSVAGVRLVLDALPASHEPGTIDPAARPLEVGLVPADSLLWRVPGSAAAPAPPSAVPSRPSDPVRPAARPPARPPATPPGRSGLITGVPRDLPGGPSSPIRPDTPVPPGFVPPGLVQAAPGDAGPPAPPASAPPPPPTPASPPVDPGRDRAQPPPDHDGLTVARPGPPPASSPAGGAGHPPGDPRSVLALVCPQGHPNPPSQPVCRTCLLALAGPARRVARPTLGVVRGAGVELELTGPVVIGRKPRRQPGGAEEPLLLPVAVPHVSGSHVELRIDGWAVLAADLDSTNGTFLRRRGEPTMRLSSTPTPLVDGDVLDLGHGVQLTVEGLP